MREKIATASSTTNFEVKDLKWKNAKQLKWKQKKKNLYKYFMKWAAVTSNKNNLLIIFGIQSYIHNILFI